MSISMKSTCLITTVTIATLVLFLRTPEQTAHMQHSDVTPGAVFTVMNTNDSGAGSFRQAIIDANASAGTDEIRFQIGTGAVNIHHSSALPEITQPVIIDGTTQPGFGGIPLVRLSSASNGVFKITGGGSTIKSIAVAGGFRDGGIILENGGGNVVSGCYIGICPQDPTANCGNPVNGIQIINSPNNVIGGTTAADRNLIGGNGANGIEITGSTSSGNIIIGNYIGLLADNTPKKNESSGVFINGAPNNRVGGTTAGERNVISDNGDNGPFFESLSNVLISGAAATGNTVQGNYIGTTIDGTARLGDFVSNHVRIQGGASNNTIGGTVGTTPGGACTGACNLISGNAGIGNLRGVMITGSGSMNNSVLGNFIGTNVTGTAGIDNDLGVVITAAAANNTVGGTTAAGRNLIVNGLMLTAGATTNIVQGNYIGTDTTGNTGIGFLSGGGISAAVTISSAPNNSIGTATGTTLGGACTGGCNLISGNNLLGVLITGSGSMNNHVDYNYIGLNAAGTAALRNGGGAITLQSGSSNNTIGRPLDYFYQSTTPAPSTTILVQDRVTGDYFQFDTATRRLNVKSCRGERFLDDVISPNDIEQRGTLTTVTTVRFGYIARFSFDLTTGIGSGKFRIELSDGSSKVVTVVDSNISNNMGTCPTEGMQIVLGTIANNANNDTFNFLSVGSSANGLVNLSSPTADGNFFHQGGSFTTYSNLFVNTNGSNFPPIALAAGTDNPIKGLDWTGFAPGGTVNYPIDLNDNQIRDPNDPLDPDGGANRTQNHPVITSVQRLLGGDARVNFAFNSLPNRRFSLHFYLDEDYGFFPGTEITNQNIREIKTIEIMTNANGDATATSITLIGADAETVLFSKGRLRVSATLINQVPIAAEFASTSFVDVPGDTSELSPPVSVPQPRFDFDRDGKTDIAVYRPGSTPTAESIWYIFKSSNSTFVAQQFGIGEDKIVAGDYQGDGVVDFAVFRPSTGVWYHSRISGNPATNFVGMQWGSSTDIPVPGDYDDDGANDAAIFRPSTGTWWIRRSLDGSALVQQFGLGTDKPAPADYDGDGNTDVAVYRNGTWYISVCPACPLRYAQFGIAEDVPVPADYDGDGRDDIAVWRPSTRVWYLLRSTAGFTAVQFGVSTDIPLNADFDADGKNDISIWRPSTGDFWHLRSSDGGVSQMHWGQSGDVPVARAQP